jgi:hypothetical protein
MIMAIVAQTKTQRKAQSREFSLTGCALSNDYRYAFTSYTYDYVMICRFTHHVSRAPDAALPSLRPFAPPIADKMQQQ